MRVWWLWGTAAAAAAAAALSDDHFMGLALQQAQRAAAINEVPVGAVLVRDGEVVATAHNQVEHLADASAHAEMLCMRRAAHSARNWRLLDATLYSTLEPCAMCLAAAHAFRVARVVYAAPDLRLGAVDTWDGHPFHSLTIDGGVRREEATRLLKDFFKQRRTGRNLQLLGFGGPRGEEEVF